MEGAIDVIDMPLGDAPISIDAWLPAFVSTGTRCELRDEADAVDRWICWGQASGRSTGYAPTAEPPTSNCVYHHIPLLHERRNSPSEALTPRESIGGLIDQTTIFRGWLDRLGASYVDTDIPSSLSAYEPLTLESMCDQHGHEGGYPICRRL